MVTSPADSVDDGVEVLGEPRAGVGVDVAPRRDQRCAVGHLDIDRETFIRHAAPPSVILVRVCTLTPGARDCTAWRSEAEGGPAARCRRARPPAWPPRLVGAALTRDASAQPPRVAADRAADRDPDPTPDRRRRRQRTRGWPITNMGRTHDIEGWADHVSVSPGDGVRLYVSTVSPTFSVKAFRMGWYDGAQATEVWHVDNVPGKEQGDPVLDDDDQHRVDTLVAVGTRPHDRLAGRRVPVPTRRRRRRAAIRARSPFADRRPRARS